MGRYYHIEVESSSSSALQLKIGFGQEAQNDVVVVDAVQAIRALNLKGGPLVKFDGPASLPVAFALAHAVAHLFGAVAVKDPKLGKFVVAISHDPQLTVGTLID